MTGHRESMVSGWVPLPGFYACGLPSIHTISVLFFGDSQDCQKDILIKRYFFF